MKLIGRLPLMASHIGKAQIDMGYYGEPFNSDGVRAELDAYFTHFYGLARDELCYILDPKKVQSEDFPGEIFRVLKEKEVSSLGSTIRDVYYWMCGIIWFGSRLVSRFAEWVN